MPRIPNYQYEEDWNFDTYDDHNDKDDVRDRLGRKVPRKEKDWEEQRRDMLRKRYRDE